MSSPTASNSDRGEEKPPVSDGGEENRPMIGDRERSLPSGKESPDAPRHQKRRRPVLTIREMAVFAMFGALMFSSTIVLSALPNVHLLGMFIVLLTVVYRVKALIPLYLFVFLYGLYYGFATWWLPYLYIWTILWGAVMLLPRRMPKGVCMIVYPLVSGLHGLLFGTLWAPAQMIFMMTKDSFSWQALIAWIGFGLPYDAMHGASNFVFGFLVYPLSVLLRKLERRSA